MDRRGHGKLRFAAVAVLVVLALTGFSTGKSRGHGDSDGGGGCSSSGQDHDGSSSSGGTTSSGGSSGTYHGYDDDDDGTTGGSGGSSDTSTTELRDAEAEVTKCVSVDAPYATVKVTNPNSVAGTFAVEVYFYDEGYDTTIDQQSADVEVPAKGTTEIKLTLKKAGLAAKVGHCEVDLYVPPVS